MDSDRLKAFTDGVLAVVITIMVLELRPPEGASPHDLLELGPVFLSYLLSFIYVAIYWNNHHHFFMLIPKVDGAILWSNLALLFCLSLIPFSTAWFGEHALEPWPTALYGAVLLACAVAWYVMQSVIIRAQGPDSKLRRAIGGDWKGKASPFFYLAGIGAAFFSPWVSTLIYAGVAAVWLIPDRRVHRFIQPEHG